MLKLKNPIPASVQDAGDIRDFFSHYFKDKKLVIPYYGTSEATSHWMLNVLHTLCTKSPSYKSSERDISNFAFSRRVFISNAQEAGLETETEELTPVQFAPFVKELKALGIKFTDFSQLSRQLFSHRSQSGNAFLKIQVFKEGEVYKVFFKPVHYKKCAFIWTNPTQVRKILVVNSWNKNTLGKKGNIPEVLPVSEICSPFNWVERKGYWETVLHLKTEGNDESDWYGRPNILSVMEWMYSEAAVADHSCKVNSTETTTKDIFAFKQEPLGIDQGGDDDQDDNFKSLMRSLRKVTTSQGENPSTIAGFEYVDEAPTHYQLGINRDTDWFKAQTDKASLLICAALNWSAELVSTLQTKSGIGDGKIINLFSTKNVTTVRPLSEEFEDMWQSVFSEIGELTGKPILGEYRVNFKNVLQELIEALKSKNESKNTTNADGNADVRKD